MVVVLASVRANSDQMERSLDELLHADGGSLVSSAAGQAANPASPISSSAAANAHSEHGWCVPSAIASHPEEARARIPLPEFDEALMKKARAIADCFPFAESEHRSSRCSKQEK